MNIYSHTQVGTLVLIALGIGIAVSGAILILAPATNERYLVGAVMGLLLLCMVLFRTLKVEVDAGELMVSFGPGVIRRRFQINEVTSTRVVRNPWYYGWGIRLTPHGWMFNVSGYDAVEVELANQRRFRIGTNDPEGLVEAIRKAHGGSAKD